MNDINNLIFNLLFFFFILTGKSTRENQKVTCGLFVEIFEEFKRRRRRRQGSLLSYHFLVWLPNWSCLEDMLVSAEHRPAYRVVIRLAGSLTPLHHGCWTAAAGRSCARQSDRHRRHGIDPLIFLICLFFSTLSFIFVSFYYKRPVQHWKAHLQSINQSQLDFSRKANKNRANHFERKINQLK